MKPVRMMIATLLIVAAAGCTTEGKDVFGRKTPLDASAVGQTQVIPDVSIAKINVVVPKTLTVSEENSYHPKADIVWRGDPYGDRYEQVKSIFVNGFSAGAKTLKGKQRVIVDVEVLRFHALTERTRYTIGGIHSIEFAMTVRDAKTGAVLVPSRFVKADLKGFGGEAAVRAERIGQTQRVRITDHLARVLVEQLRRPFGA